MNDFIGKEILLVEDNPAEARLIVEVFDEFAIKNNITISNRWQRSHGLFKQKRQI